MSVTALPVSPVASAAAVGTSVARDPTSGRAGSPVADFAALLERAAAAPAEPVGTAVPAAAERDRRVEPLATATGPAAVPCDAADRADSPVDDPPGAVVTGPDSTTTESTGADSVAAVASGAQASPGTVPVVALAGLPAGSASVLGSADADANPGTVAAVPSGPVPAGPSGELPVAVNPGPGQLAPGAVTGPGAETPLATGPGDGPGSVEERLLPPQTPASPPVPSADPRPEHLAGPVSPVDTALLGTAAGPVTATGPVTVAGPVRAAAVGTSPVGVPGSASPADAGDQLLEVVPLAPAPGAGNEPVAMVSGTAPDADTALPATTGPVPGVIGAAEVAPAGIAGSAPQPTGEQLRTPLGDHVASLASTLRQDGAGNARVVLRLDPPELGSVTITVSLRGGEVRVVLLAADPAAAAALEARRAEVRASLASGGLALDSYSVGADAGSGRERPGTPWRPADAAWRRTDPGSDWTTRSADRVTSGVWL